MIRLRSLLPVAAMAILSIPLPVAADDPLFATFVEVKNQYKAKKYDQADTALRHMAELLAAPEFAAVRPKVLPAFHFYSAAVAWELKQEDRARASLHEYFTLQPNATLDQSAYPKRFGQFFEVEKGKFDKEAGATAGPQSSEGAQGAYASFVPEGDVVPQYAGTPEWADSAVRFILTDDEKKAFRALGDDASRREWVAHFWSALDPNPLTPVNEYQEEFYRRVQWSDTTFSTESTKGSLSDRGMVFIVLGPPSFAKRARLKESDDPIGSARHTMVMGEGGGSASARVEAGDSLIRRGQPTVRNQTSGGYVPGSGDGETEEWTYRGDRIPRGIPYSELTFQFMTRKGYGEAVLQKDARQLTALGKAVKMLRNPASGG